MSDVIDFLGDGIPYDLRDYWKKTKMLCLICHVFRGVGILEAIKLNMLKGD